MYFLDVLTITGPYYFIGGRNCQQLARTPKNEGIMKLGYARLLFPYSLASITNGTLAIQHCIISQTNMRIILVK
jgi:hypothetical protein